MSYFDSVRVRIAPSPTGDPHVGTAYTTLFNYVFAKKHKGKLILRVEDTDQVRAKSSSQQQIMDCLTWLGLKWDEGPDVGGPYGPYLQSERTQIYQEHVQKLIEGGTAYYCFCSPERLAIAREEQKTAGNHRFGYDRHCRNLGPTIIKEKLAQGVSKVIRLKMPDTGVVNFRDELRGDIEFSHDQLDDQVLLKSDGFPTYHLANVVDDHLMKVSHVIRAEEWISSTPKHVVLYEAFGWEKPQFIHLPLLRNSDRSKISKRKNPVSLNYYRRKGILPVALVNFLGLMGWSYSPDQEIFSITEMIEKFSPEQMHLGGPVFDLEKLLWLNHHYLQQLSPEDFVKQLTAHLFSEEILRGIAPLFKERISSFEEFVDKAGFFFNGTLHYSHTDLVPQGKTALEMGAMFTRLVEELDELYDWDISHLEVVIAKVQKELGWKAKDVFMPIRIAVTGRKDSPPLLDCLQAVGREMVRFRLRCAINIANGV